MKVETKDLMTETLQKVPHRFKVKGSGIPYISLKITAEQL